MYCYCKNCKIIVFVHASTKSYLPLRQPICESSSYSCMAVDPRDSEWRWRRRLFRNGERWDWSTYCLPRYWGNAYGMPRFRKPQNLESKQWFKKTTKKTRGQQTWTVTRSVFNERADSAIFHIPATRILASALYWIGPWVPQPIHRYTDLSMILIYALN